MCIEIGDLVKCKDKQLVGIVVNKRLSNQGLTNSMHVRHILGVYPNVYYVYINGIFTGPHLECDLMLQQHNPNNQLFPTLIHEA